MLALEVSAIRTSFRKRINLDETGQTADVRVRDGSEVYWKECGEDCKAFGKCIKMKDLLR